MRKKDNKVNNSTKTSKGGYVLTVILTCPVTSNSTVGEELPIPNLVLELSQCKFVL